MLYIFCWKFENRLIFDEIMSFIHAQEDDAFFETQCSIKPTEVWNEKAAKTNIFQRPPLRRRHTQPQLWILKHCFTSRGGTKTNIFLRVGPTCKSL